MNSRLMEGTTFWIILPKESTWKEMNENKDVTSIILDKFTKIYLALVQIFWNNIRLLSY
jgi:hypothetical protein